MLIYAFIQLREQQLSRVMHTHTLCFHYPELSTSYATLSWKNE